MIRIFKMGDEPLNGTDRPIVNEILIEPSDSDIIESHVWDEDNPHIKIYLQNNFEFFKQYHVKNSDCRVFHDDFGTDKSWYIEVDGVGYPLDLRSFKGRDYHHNNCVSIHGYFENGTILKLKVYLE